MNKIVRYHDVKTLHLVIFLIIPFYLILSVSFLTIGHYWGGDFSAYIMQAESILDGTVQQFIEENTFTIKNTLPGLGPIIYPWGYPVLILPAVYFFGINLWAIKTINILFYFLFLICIYFLFVNRLGKFKLFVLLCLFAFSPVLLEAHDFILSEIPFLFFSTFSILLMDFLVVSERKFISYPIDNMLIGASIFLAFSIRQNGALLLLVLIFCQIVQLLRYKKNKQFILNRFLPNILFSFALFFFLGLYRIFFVNDSTQLIYILENINEVPIFKKLHFYLLLLPTFITNFSYESSKNQFFVFALFPFLIAGLFHRWKNDYHFVFYSGLILSFYLLFPSMYFRYIIPALPFYMYFVLIGMGQLGRLFERNHLLNIKLLGHGLIILLLIFEFTWTSTLAAENLRNNREIPGPFDPVSSEMFKFVSENTEPESKFSFFKPRVLRFFTGRNSYRATRCKDLILADYLIVHKYKDKYWNSDSNLEKCSPQIKFNQFFKNQNFSIYVVNKH